MKNNSNYSSIPNWFLDALPLLDLTNYQYKVLLVLVRESYGYHQTESYTATSWLVYCSNITNRRNVARVLKELNLKGLISFNKSGLFYSNTTKFKINKEPFLKLCQESYPQYPKRILKKVSPEIQKVSPEIQKVSPEIQKVSPETHHKEIYQINNQINNQIQPNPNDLLTDLSKQQTLKQYTDQQIQLIRAQIAKQINASAESEAVSIHLNDLVVRVSKQRNVRNLFAYTLNSAKMIGLDIKQEIKR